MEARNDNNWPMSALAQKRAAQRNIDPRLFDLLQRHGKRIYLDGDLHGFFGENMVPEDAPQPALKNIVNTMVIVAPDGTVKTLFKTHKISRNSDDGNSTSGSATTGRAGCSKSPMPAPEQLFVLPMTSPRTADI